MVSSEGKGRADVWSAEASLNFDVPEDESADVAELLVAMIDAVAMDSRERTRSNGYVVPAQKIVKKDRQVAKHNRKDEQTEVMPASAPLANRVGVSSCFFPFEVNHYGERY